MKRKEAKSTRYERWLSLVAAHLSKQQARTHLAYDDRHLGDRLVLSVPLDEGFVELQVVRQKKGANLCVLAQNQAAADRLVALFNDLHKTAKRRHNAKRKFLHRFEWMSQHLQQTFEPRRQRFPEPALERLRQLLPVAEPLIGVRAPFQKKPDAEDDRLELEAARGRLARQLKRYRLLFAALIPTQQGGRAALYYKNAEAFCPRGEGLNVVVGYLRETGMDADTMALLAPPTPDGKPGEWKESVVGDGLQGVDAAGDAAELAGHLADLIDYDLTDAGDGDVCWDMGGPDLPDCGACDVADCAGLGCDLPI